MPYTISICRLADVAELLARRLPSHLCHATWAPQAHAGGITDRVGRTERTGQQSCYDSIIPRTRPQERMRRDSSVHGPQSEVSESSAAAGSAVVRRRQTEEQSRWLRHGDDQDQGTGGSRQDCRKGYRRSCGWGHRQARRECAEGLSFLA